MGEGESGNAELEQEQILASRFPAGSKIRVRRSNKDLEEGWEILMHTRNEKKQLSARVFNRDKNINKTVPLAELAEYN